MEVNDKLQKLLEEMQADFGRHDEYMRFLGSVLSGSGPPLDNINLWPERRECDSISYSYDYTTLMSQYKTFCKSGMCVLTSQFPEGVCKIMFGYTSLMRDFRHYIFKILISECRRRDLVQQLILRRHKKRFQLDNAHSLVVERHFIGGAGFVPISLGVLVTTRENGLDVISFYSSDDSRRNVVASL